MSELNYMIFTVSIRQRQACQYIRIKCISDVIGLRRCTVFHNYVFPDVTKNHVTSFARESWQYSYNKRPTTTRACAKKTIIMLSEMSRVS
jgi:hypothetical protein